MKAVILAGGSGTRLWPASTTATPKQFLDIDGEGALLLQTLRRCSLLGVDTDCYVVTRDEYELQVASLLTAFNPKMSGNIIVEPAPRSTAPAILLAAKYLEDYANANADDVILICPSDHLIQDDHKLVRYFELGNQLAQEGYIVTFGVVPTKPDTGYGYIKAKVQQPAPEKGVEWLAQGLPIQEFKEKPDLETAQEYLAQGGYFWNAGIFAMTIGTLYQELEKHFPVIKPYLDLNYKTLAARFNDVPSIAFDVAVMEKTDCAVVIPIDVRWSDVGSWDSVYQILPQDALGNCIQGSVAVSNTQGSLLINKTDRPMAAVGLNNMIAVQTDDGLLLVNRGSSQYVRNILPDVAKQETKALSAIPG